MTTNLDNLKEIQKMFNRDPKMKAILEKLETEYTQEPDDDYWVKEYKLKGSGETRFEAQIYVGFKGGKRVYKSFIAKTESQVRKKVEKFKAQVEITGKIPKSRKKVKSVGEYLQEWLQIKEGQVSSLTLSSYTKYLNTYILKPTGEFKKLPQIAHIKIDQLEVSQVNRLLKAMVKMGKHGRTVTHLKTVLKNAFNYAEDSKDIEDNIFNYRSMYKPKVPVAKSYHYSEAEYNRILDAALAPDCEIGAFIHLIAQTGQRTEEIRALTWGDIDLESGIIRTNKAVVYVNGKGWVLGDTKTSKSNRETPLADVENNEAIQLLKKMYATRSSELLFNGTTIDANPSAFNVFSYLDNRYWGIKWLDTRFKKLLKQAKVTRYTGGLHTFRHTVATLLDGANVSPNKIQQHLGHSDVRTTLNMYIHNNDQDSEVSNTLQSIRKSKRKTG